MDGKMYARVFISTNGRGVSRAIREEDDKWSVDFLLDGQDIHCLATDPLNPTVVFAGRQEGGYCSRVIRAYIGRTLVYPGLQSSRWL